MDRMPRSAHVLVMGWDGVRDDVRQDVSTPHLDALAARGFGSAVRVHAKNPTISGPVWTTMATGVHSDLHGITANDPRGQRLDEHPTFLDLLGTQRPRATSFAAAAWAPLVELEEHRPLFPGGYRPAIPGPDDVAGRVALDEAVVARTARELLGADHAVVFACLDLPDETCHQEGVSAAYRRAVEICDAHLGTLLAAIAARPDRAQEDWTIIVLTDHGHLDGGGHGGESPEERTAWIVAAGPGICEDSARAIEQADVMAQVLHALDLPLDQERIDGRPFGSRWTSVPSSPSP